MSSLNHKRSIDLMPMPFAWVDIPTGKVKVLSDKSDRKHSYLKRDTIFEIPAFTMGKYPISNEQYGRFIEAGGYDHKPWWTETGWARKVEEKWIEPLYWRQTKWNRAKYPVVGVSWYETIAFCLWLSNVTEENITLSTEQQWQRAGQGDRSLIYPWGNDWDTLRCNSSENHLNHTTHVLEYAVEGNSVYGVVDLVGNVWEWTMTSYFDGTQEINSGLSAHRILRGGAWLFNRDFARLTSRNFSAPDHRYFTIGFRIARSL